MDKRTFKKTSSIMLYCIIAALLMAALTLTGCASGTALESHQKGIEGVAEKEYFIPKKPIDRHYIGCAWSKQFGPVEDPASADIRVKKEKSFNNVQQDFAYNRGIALGGQSIVGPGGQIGASVGIVKKADL